jgi:very-short-patch-repair endonuclease
MNRLPIYRLNKQIVRQSRRHPTSAEYVLWEYLSRKRLQGSKFRRQVPIGPYIADFCCFKKRLIIEVDGRHHNLQKVPDENRTAYLLTLGFRVLRFSNDLVLNDIGRVLKTIKDFDPSPSKERVPERRPAQAGEV